MDIRASDPDGLDDISNPLESGTVKLTTAQRQELDRRIDVYMNDPSGNIPWETIKSDALARKGDNSAKRMQKG